MFQFLYKDKLQPHHQDAHEDYFLQQKNFFIILFVINHN